MIKIIVPTGMFGKNKHDTTLDRVLREISIKCPKTGEWTEKYGATFESDIFLIHPFCWCEKESCLWCCGCKCPNNVEYYLDGKQIEDWWEANEAILGPWKLNKDDEETAEFNRRIEERDRRLIKIYSEVIHTCSPLGLMENRKRGNTWMPPQTAPNFWYKLTGFKVWWYKWIGRDMEINRPILLKGCQDMYTKCINSFI